MTNNNALINTNNTNTNTNTFNNINMSMHASCKSGKKKTST